MESKYKIYKIKKGDTLKSIAKTYEKTQQEIKGFHNIFCSHEEIIKTDFPETLEQLYIYPHLDFEINDNRAKVNFQSAQNLVFNPLMKKLNYGVLYTITVGNEINTMKFETSVECIKNNNNEFFIFEINRLSKTFVNDQDTDSVADQLAEKVATVLYPLEIIVNKDGIWKGIHNFKNILKRWKETKSKILAEYQGDWVENYLKLNDETLSEQFFLEQELSKDWFLSAYFGTIYVNYTDFYKTNKIIKFPLITNCTTIEYNVEQTIKKYVDEYGLVNIEQIGILSDPRSKTDLENKSSIAEYSLTIEGIEKAEGTFRSKYFLDYDNSIQSMYLESTIKLKVPKKVEVTISLLES